MYDFITFFQMFIYNDMKHLQVYNSGVTRQGSFLQIILESCSNDNTGIYFQYLIDAKQVNMKHCMFSKAECNCFLDLRHSAI